VNKLLVETLGRFGIDPSAFTPYEEDAGIIGATVPGSIAVALWKSLRQHHTATGLWPVIRQLDFNEQPGGAEAVSAPLPAGDAPSLLKPQLEELIESYEEMLEQNLTGLTLTELAHRIDRSAVLGPEDETRAPDRSPWPTEPPDIEPTFQAVLDWETNAPVDEVHLALVPAKQPWDAISRLQFGGWNSCPSPDVLAAVAREWNGRYGAVPAVITMDVLEFHVERPPTTEAECMQLAAEQFVLCEDIVSQGTLSIRDLAAALWRSPNWYFWWD